MATNPFLVDDEQAPGVNPLATQTGIPSALVQALNTRSPYPSPAELDKPGVVKKFFTGYLDNMTRSLTGRPSAYQEQVKAQTLALEKMQQETALMNAQTLAGQRAASEKYNELRSQEMELSDISAEEAKLMGNPALAGVKMNAKAKAAMLKGQQTVAGASAKQDDQQAFTAEQNDKQAELRKWLATTGIANRAKGGGQSQSGQLTPEAKTMAAEMYRKTGMLPPLGMGAAGTRTEILNEAARMGKVDVAANKADYAANQSSLNQITKSLDAVTAFESTAAKNLDVFTSQAKKVVDSGAPWINKPLRSLDMGGMGSEDVAAYKAARQVALTEVARVVSNPNLVGVLSDEARREIAEFNPESATLKQTLRVVEILKQDMKNRKDGLSNQRREIQGRISGQQSGADTVIVVDPQGKPWTVPKTNLQKLLIDHPDFKVQSNGR